MGETILNVDRLLGGIERPFGRYPNTFSFGPTGRRLWVNYLSDQPGFDGLVDYIHKTNIPALYRLEFVIDGKTVPAAYRSHQWSPSHLIREQDCGPLRLRETLFVTWDDVAVDVLTLENTGEAPVQVAVRASSDLAFADTPAGISWPRRGQREMHGETVHYVFDSSLRDETLELPPQLPITVYYSLALDTDPARPADRARYWVSDPEAPRTQKAQYAAWFADVPRFECDRDDLNRMWAYRWYLARRNLASPGAGRLPHPLYWEGRSHKCSNDPWNPTGWEFSKLIPFSTPFHVLEGMWRGDLAPVRGELRNLVLNQAEDGTFRCATIQKTGSYYFHFIPRAVLQLHRLRPDADFLAEVAPALARNVDAWAARFDTGGDGLMVVHDPNRTGKEYQPSYWAFSNYPRDPKEGLTPLARVDATVYFILNASAVAEILEILGQPEAARYRAMADRSRAALCEWMWDPETRFFYDVRPGDQARAPVRNVVGFDPYLDEALDGAYLEIFRELDNPATFGAAHPIPSVEIGNPAFAPDASWAGKHIKGPHGAVWNGPAWPFTNTTTLMALGQAAQRFPGRGLEAAFARLFDAHTRLQHRDGQPMVVEHYNPLTGEAISQEEDYYHSGWIDLVIRFVVGVTPRNDDVLELRPLDIGLSRFVCEGIPWRGRSLSVTWDDATGLTAVVDGETVLTSPVLEPCAVNVADAGVRRD